MSLDLRKNFQFCSRKFTIRILLCKDWKHKNVTSSSKIGLKYFRSKFNFENFIKDLLIRQTRLTPNFSVLTPPCGQKRKLFFYISKRKVIYLRVVYKQFNYPYNYLNIYTIMYIYYVPKYFFSYVLLNT